MNNTTRRHFLQTMLAASAAGVLVPRWATAAGAAPLGGDQGAVVVVDLSGGCDSLEVLVPIAGARRGAYESARGDIAVGVGSTLGALGDHGLSPYLPALADRYAAGEVAVIDGVGMPDNLRSHFMSAAVAQSASTSPLPTGWLGRHLEGHVEAADELLSVALSSIVPLHARGAVNECATMPVGLGMWGADRSQRFERRTIDAVRSFADAPSGRGPWGDQIAATAAYALDKAAVSGGLATSPTAETPLVAQFTVAANVLNADIGTRAVGVTTSGYDTHANQRVEVERLLGDLDAGIEAFFATLAPERQSRVVVLVVSEFGRMVPANASGGTDHGHAGVALVVGANVAGGVYGDHPDIARPDAHDSLVPTVDLREVYATIVDDWLDGDASEVLGRSFPSLGLIRSGPGVSL